MSCIMDNAEVESREIEAELDTRSIAQDVADVAGEPIIYVDSDGEETVIEPSGEEPDAGTRASALAAISMMEENDG